jgi:hypothetical protein
MPRPKNQGVFIAEAGDVSDLTIQPGGIQVIPDQHLDLLKFVSRTIRTINVNGKPMTGKCRLCAQARINREPCRHEEIWRLAGQ